MGCDICRPDVAVDVLFVLLLSFSEIDAQKFKQIAGELSAAFGVQRDVPAVEMPMGTSIIFDNFSSAPAEPTVINEIKQTTTDQKPKVDTLRGAVDSAATAAEQKKYRSSWNSCARC